MRQVFTQGDFDGACLLYSLANAYTAVTGITPSCCAWDRGIRSLQRGTDFLGGCIGTTEPFWSDPPRLREAVSILLDSFNQDGPRVQWEHLPEAWQLREVAALVDGSSVVVFRYTGVTAQVVDVDHWVTGVAWSRTPFRLYLACSYRGTRDNQAPGRRYRERYHRDLHRYSNNWVDDRHGIRIVPGSVFRISALRL